MVRSINWTEGMFIQPHHFQQAFLDIEERLQSVMIDFIPHFTGVARLEVGPCDGYQFEIQYIDCRLPDGTRIVGGTRAGDSRNAEIEPLGFQTQLEKAGHRLDVYLGLPILQDGVANCLRFNDKAMGGHRHRYISVENRVPDLVSGKNEQTIEHKLYKPRLLFRWHDKEGETGDSIEGYDTLKLAELELSTKRGEYHRAPQIREAYVPPCTAISASPLLTRYTQEIMSRLYTEFRSLRDYWRHKDTANLMKTRDTLKVQAVTAAALGLRQFSSLDRLHPFTLYVKLAEITGTLSIYTNDDKLLDLPDYNHNDLGACFFKMHENLVKLLALLEDFIYDSRSFEKDKDNLLICPMKEEWLTDNQELFICFETPMQEPEVAKATMGLKIASSNMIDYLNQKRLRGVKLEGPVHHLSSLPYSAHHHYFKLPRDTIFFPKLKEHPTLAIWGRQFAELVKFYAVDKENLK